MKITKKDYISWSIALLAIAVSIVLSIKNRQFKDNRQQVHNVAKTIQQNYYFNSLPLEFQRSIQLISSRTAPIDTGIILKTADSTEEMR